MAQSKQNKKDFRKKNLLMSELDRRKAQNLVKRKILFEREFRYAVIKAIVGNTQLKTNLETLRALVVPLFEINKYEIRGFLKRYLRDTGKGNSISRFISRASEADLLKLFNCVRLGGEYRVGEGNLKRKSKLLKSYAESWGFDTDAIRQQVKDALTNCLNSCEFCGCTDLTLCYGGCSWDPGSLKEKRHICSRCIGIKFDRDKRL